MAESELKHVSDTALMVAAARAIETEREDRLSADPYAAKLAGERGFAALTSQSRFWLAFGMGLRTKFVDEFILHEIGTQDIDCIVNLGAGLDTRPWRLNLIPTLRWIEADFPAMLDYKHGALEDEKPRCQLERMSADLTDPQDRRRIWDAIPNQHRVLLLTEGLLMYLPEAAVRGIASEAHNSPVHSWIFDIGSKALMQASHGSDAAQKIESLAADDRLKDNEVRDAIAETGWRFIDEKRFVREGGRYARDRIIHDQIPYDPETAPQVSPDDPGGIVLFRK